MVPQSSGGSCLLETGGQKMFLFRSIVQRLFASYVRIYEI